MEDVVEEERETRHFVEQIIGNEKCSGGRKRCGCALRVAVSHSLVYMARLILFCITILFYRESG